MRHCLHAALIAGWTMLTATSATPTIAFAQLPVVRDDLPPPLPVVQQAAVRAAPDSVIALSGQILRTKQVDVRGTTEKVLVALLDTGDGQRQIVDLGPTLNFKGFPLRTNDPVTLRGSFVTVGEVSVFAATNVYVGNDSVDVKRVAPEPGAAVAAVAVAAGYPVTEQIVKISGRIEKLRMARIRGSRTEHLIAEIVNSIGGAVVVDLGPPTALWRADLKAGDSITIRGQQMKINNRPVLLALEINKTGIPYLIERNLVYHGPAVVTP